jgi:uncharacterized protein
MSLLRRSERVTFPGGSGHQLAGILDLPNDPPRAWILFTHCFTCTKDIKLIVRISRGLAEHGFAVLRYDLTGLGHSHGEFEHSNFSTNQADLLSAVEFLKQHYSAPEFLIGHSFGGAVSLSLAQQVPSVRGAVSIAAPSDTHHLASLLEKLAPQIVSEGHGEVTIGGMKHRIRRQMVEDFRTVQLPKIVERLTKAVLILHSPDDETLSYEHAVRLYQLLTERPADRPSAPATLVCLSETDHLFTRNNADLVFVTQVIAAWISRQLAIVDNSNTSQPR